GHSGTRLLHGYARADVLAEDGFAEQSGAAETAAQHAFAELRVARRQALDGVRYAGRRAAGSMGADLLPAHDPLRPQYPAGDRHAELPLRALAEQLLAACRTSGASCDRRPLRQRRTPRAAIA